MSIIKDLELAIQNLNAIPLYGPNGEYLDSVDDIVHKLNSILEDTKRMEKERQEDRRVISDLGRSVSILSKEVRGLRLNLTDDDDNDDSDYRGVDYGDDDEGAEYELDDNNPEVISGEVAEVAADTKMSEGTLLYNPKTMKYCILKQPESKE